MVLVTLLHATHQLLTLVVQLVRMGTYIRKVNRMTGTEIRLEEVSEGWKRLELGWLVIRVLAWENWFEEDWSRQPEPLKVWMQKLACRENPRSLERMASNHCWVSVVGYPLQSSEPRPGLSVSLSYLLSFVGSSVELKSHILI